MIAVLAPSGYILLCACALTYDLISDLRSRPAFSEIWREALFCGYFWFVGILLLVLKFSDA